MGGGYLRYRTNFLEQLPLPQKYQISQQKIVFLINRIIAAKRADPTAGISILESEIDCLVYALYGLTQEEIAIVEGRSA